MGDLADRLLSLQFELGSFINNNLVLFNIFNRIKENLTVCIHCDEKILNYLKYPSVNQHNPTLGQNNKL